MGGRSGWGEGEGHSLLGLCVVEEIAGFDVPVNDVQLVDTPQRYQQVLHVVAHVAHVKRVKIVLQQMAWKNCQEVVSYI